MNNISAQEKLGRLVAQHPYTAEVLNKYKIDYSFQGDLTLDDAIKKGEFGSQDILGEIDLAIDEFKLLNSDVIYWENEPIDRILDHIEGKHHTFMERTMEEISDMLSRVPPGLDLSELSEVFTDLRDDMLIHQKKEEEELFPLLRRYSRNRTAELRHKIVKYMTDTEDEHDEAGRMFKEINMMTEDFTLPEDCDPFIKELYAKLDELEKDAFLHIHMENSILFKMI